MILNVDRHPVDFGVRSVLDADRMDHTERWVLRLTSCWKWTLSSLRALMTDDTHRDLKNLYDFACREHLQILVEDNCLKKLSREDNGQIRQLI